MSFMVRVESPEILDDAASAGQCMYRIEKNGNRIAEQYDSGITKEMILSNVSYSAMEVQKSGGRFSSAFLGLSKVLARTVGFSTEEVQDAEVAGKNLIDDYNALNAINIRNP